MNWEHTIFSVFYLSFLIGVFLLGNHQSGVAHTMYARYGIRGGDRGFRNNRKRLKKVATPEDWELVLKAEKRFSRFVGWGLLILVVVTATYGLTKAALR